MWWETYGSSFLVVGALLLIFLAAYYTTRFLSKSSAGLSKSKYMRVKDNMYIGRDKSVMIVEVAGRYYVVGVTGQSFSMLGEIAQDELIAMTQEQKSDGSPAQTTPMGKVMAAIKNFISAPAQLNQARQQNTARSEPQKDEPSATLKKREQPTKPQAAPVDERDEIDLILQSIHQRKNRTARRNDGDDNQ